MRAHQQHLPAAARELGDGYVRAEFRLHRGASETFMPQFERQWRDYLTTLRRAPTEGTIGRQMTSEEVAALSDEQKVQLMKIHEEATTVSEPTDGNSKQ